MKTKVAIYIRVSTKDRQETNNQLIQLKEFCERSKWDIYKVYTDKISGSKSDRPAFQEMFLHAHQKKFNTVLFWALDRFSREGVLDTLQHLKKLETAGVDFKSYTEPYIDSMGVFRDAILAIIASMAKQERIRLSERVKAGMDRARKEGKRISRPGLDKTKIEKIRKLKAAGIPIKQIVRETGVSRPTVKKYLT